MTSLTKAEMLLFLKDNPEEDILVQIFREEMQKEQAKMLGLPEKLRKCKACNAILILGQAIDPLYTANGIYMTDNALSWDDVTFIDVWKCPDCGVSTSLTE